jgi:hypothetical protein
LAHQSTKASLTKSPTHIKRKSESEFHTRYELISSRAIHALHNVPGQKPSITPIEVANAIFFLASDQARAINGISLPIDRAWGVI